MSFLLVAEDEIDPLVQVRVDVVRLQGLPVLPDEVVGVLGPLGQDDVVHSDLLVALHKNKNEIFVKGFFNLRL